MTNKKNIESVTSKIIKSSILIKNRDNLKR